MKIILSILLFLFAILSVASAEVMDVNIKGINNGVKTSRQRDYQEAVMNAKLQAIERAGASITSITKVENFKLKYDAVESKSKAVLLPGFQIIDIGYLTDGTYQVVLIGKIQVEEKETKVKEVRKDGRFIAYDNGTVLDTNTNLMWAAKDNGSNIDWQGAKSYCDKYRGGGYADWRLPTQDELANLYDMSKSRPTICSHLFNIHVATELIDITCYAPWASEIRDSEAANFYFGTGSRRWASQSNAKLHRAIPVRSGK